MPLVLAVWTFLSVSWADNTNLALFKSLKLTEFGLLFIYIAYNALNKPFIRNTVGLIVILGFIQAIIGVAQAILQHSVGLFWLRESLISLNIDGVAKVMLFGHKFIRAYGLFPHPNILGGFLLISIIFTVLYDKMFHTRPVGCSMWNIPSGVEHFRFLHSRIVLLILLLFQILALLLTFSKSAVLGLFIVICYGSYKFVSRGTLGSLIKLFHVKHFCRYLVSIVIMFALLLTILGFNINSLLFKSLNERLLYLNVSRETIADNPIVGLGMGQFVAEMQRYSSVFLANWQYQPVHNVFLLIWSELGIIGLVLFILFLWKVFRANKMFHPGRRMFHVKQFHPTGQAWNIFMFQGVK